MPSPVWRLASGMGVGVNRERILNLPGVITALIAALVLIELAVESFPRSIGLITTLYFSFIPARLTFLLDSGGVLRALSDVDADELAALLNSAQYSWWTLLSYAFLHANWTHLAVNGVTLAAFGAPVARRLGTFRFLLFFGFTAIAGALAHLAAHPFDLAPVVGASAAISGAIAAVARFAFASGGPLDGERPRAAGDAPHAALSLRSAFSNPRAATFLLTWVAANVAFGLVAQAPGGGVIAWEAHMGGFAAGFLLFGWFDPASTPLRLFRRGN